MPTTMLTTTKLHEHAANNAGDNDGGNADNNADGNPNVRAGGHAGEHAMVATMLASMLATMLTTMRTIMVTIMPALPTMRTTMLTTMRTTMLTTMRTSMLFFCSGQKLNFNTSVFCRCGCYVKQTTMQDPCSARPGNASRQPWPHSPLMPRTLHAHGAHNSSNRPSSPPLVGRGCFRTGRLDDLQRPLRIVRLRKTEKLEVSTC